MAGMMGPNGTVFQDPAAEALENAATAKVHAEARTAALKARRDAAIRMLIQKAATEWEMQANLSQAKALEVEQLARNLTGATIAKRRMEVDGVHARLLIGVRRPPRRLGAEQPIIW